MIISACAGGSAAACTAKNNCVCSSVDRAVASEAMWRGFESLQTHHITKNILKSCLCFGMFFAL